MPRSLSKVAPIPLLFEALYMLAEGFKTGIWGFSPAAHHRKAAARKQRLLFCWLRKITATV